MKPATIATNALRRLVRDRSSLFFTIMLPFAIILMVGLATGRLNDETVPVGLHSEGAGPLGAELAEALASPDILEVSAYDDIEALGGDVRRGAVAAGVVIPDDYDERLRSGEEVEVSFLAEATRGGFPAVVRTQVASAVAEQGAVLQAARFTTERVGGTFEENVAGARRTERLLPAVEVAATEIGQASEQSFSLSGFGYQAPANIVLFVFITSLAWSGQLIEARRQGLVRRVLSTPTRARTILAGETLGRFAIALVQGLYILGLGVLVFGVDFGDPLGAAAIVLAFSLVGTSFAMLLGAVLRTPEQSGMIGPVAGIAMGMLAGCMWPRFIMPEPMQRIGELFPHAYAMDAWITLIGGGGGIATISTELLILAGYSAVILPFAAWRLNRSIVA